MQWKVLQTNIEQNWEGHNMKLSKVIGRGRKIVNYTLTAGSVGSSLKIVDNKPTNEIINITYSVEEDKLDENGEAIEWQLKLTADECRRIAKDFGDGYITDTRMLPSHHTDVDGMIETKTSINLRRPISQRVSYELITYGKLIRKNGASVPIYYIYESSFEGLSVCVQIMETDTDEYIVDVIETDEYIRGWRKRRDLVLHEK
jgi:hypothetical protein